MSVHSVGVGGGIGMSEVGVQSSNRTSMHSIETQGNFCTTVHVEMTLH